MDLLVIPDAFAQCIRDVFGADAGNAWLAELPRLLARFAEQWNLEIGEPYPLSYNYVTRAVRKEDGIPVVLKLGVPGRELLSEIGALRHYDGVGCCRLYEADPEAGVFLLEAVTPGNTFVELTLENDDQATRNAAEVMRTLSIRPAPLPQFRPDGQPLFVSIADWATGIERYRQRFPGGNSPLPEEMVDSASRIFAEYLPTRAPPVLLHGDLHPGNILQSGPDQWTAIDPKGVLGEPAYEVGALLRNPSPGVQNQADLGRELSRRLSILAEELSLDRERLRGWGIAQAVLSAVWSVEDHEGRGEGAIEVARLLKSVP